ncbi:MULTISPECIES: MSMEG_0570 family nitrogen starvation response protein [Spirosoma]|uniref:MSMEG_0570 family nitrogen starvation response protein n=2 Tax=Spirosoma TaxID=107 RepID=A0A6G9AVJ9_9BACT|nr:MULTISPECIES: MSMEG_0570 family nitrogen starvation response protein [Spirosoma]QHV97782.1 MSMEG_0570 family nitrogen starvation response protein [Spirosoma endbachense]QIP16507.1 MSMEG_0570 family nitrogen starvation response protein [Spirosoma aureum]
MPEVNVTIEWPDKQKDSIYSPSTVLLQYIKSGDSLSIQDFDERISQALQLASQRVYERYGFECTSAMGELARLKARMASINDKNQLIKIL